ncbi:MAG: hypothetical protein HGA36_05345 [Candidatus Moranbacteria bacterium]|nr:hypothetical protein [Candidatus Moranbacteria bacterium]
MSKKAQKKKIIVVKENVAYSIGMSVEVAEIRVNAVLQRHKIKPAAFLSVLFEDNKVLICTTQATIECDRRMLTSEVRTPNVGHTAGRNVTGHRLPACSTGARHE